METKSVGVELIAKERQKQIDKHGFTAEHHVAHPEWYDIKQYAGDFNQLQDAAMKLLHVDVRGIKKGEIPEPINWDKEWYLNLCDRPQKERLIIAGALIAAELDRLDQLEKQ